MLQLLVKNKTKKNGVVKSETLKKQNTKKKKQSKQKFFMSILLLDLVQIQCPSQYIKVAR